jgi:hypothetical protein
LNRGSGGAAAALKQMQANAAAQHIVASASSKRSITLSLCAIKNP